jgi:hypothetical protein
MHVYAAARGPATEPNQRSCKLTKADERAAALATPIKCYASVFIAIEETLNKPESRPYMTSSRCFAGLDSNLRTHVHVVSLSLLVPTCSCNAYGNYARDTFHDQKMTMEVHLLRIRLESI